MLTEFRVLLPEFRVLLTQFCVILTKFCVLLTEPALSPRGSENRQTSSHLGRRSGGNGATSQLVRVGSRNMFTGKHWDCGLTAGQRRAAVQGLLEIKDTHRHRALR